MGATTAIVFSCDEAYVFLARGLVLSLLEAGYPDQQTQIVLIDIGCTPESRDWMTRQGVVVIPFEASLIPQSLLAIIKPMQRAQILRPWLPDLLPQYEHFIWLDCDLWLQNGEVVSILQMGARISPSAIVIATGNSHYNATFYMSLEKLLNMQSSWYRPFYDGDIADAARVRLHHSSGVFGLARASPIWQQWRDEVEELYPRVAAQDPKLVHLAEQTALNVVILRCQLFVRLDPLYNFHCNGAGALRLEDGRVVTNLLLPSREIGVIHLANWSFLRHRYVQERLLYKAGAYLTEAEWLRVNQA